MNLNRIVHTGSFRLAALFAAFFTGVAAVLTIAVYLIAGDALTSELLASIDADLSAIASGYKTEGISEAEEVIQQRLTTPGFSDFFLLESRDGKKITGNIAARPVQPGIIRLSLPMSGNSMDHTVHAVLGKGVVLPDGTYIFVGQDTRFITETRGLILRTFSWIIGIAIVIAISGGTFLSFGFMRSIDAITKNCRAIMGGRLNERIPIRGTQGELDNLAATINGMLDRIVALMESLQQVSSDIAHDLRTPLMHLRQRLETALSSADTTAPIGVIKRAIADVDDILELFSSLLSISQIEAGKANLVRLNLTALMRQVVDTYTPVAEDKGQHLEMPFAPDIFVLGDRALLMQMFANVIENAIRHTPEGTSIKAELANDGHDTTSRIIDTGPGIPSAERDKVFRRFYRLERSRSTPGNGLGLSLVSAIADLHHGQVELSDNRPGLCLTVRIPTFLASNDALGA